MNEKEQELEGLNLEDILKEFGGMTELLPEEEKTSETPEALPEEPETESPEEPEAEPELPEELKNRDTIRLDEITQVTGEKAPEEKEAEPDVTTETIRLAELPQEEPEERVLTEEEVSAAALKSFEEELEANLASHTPAPEPIAFQPRQKLRELKRKLIAGPEKRYYELSELGVGKLQIAVLLCLAIVALCGLAGFLYVSGEVSASRMRLLVYGQVLAMLLGGLLCCHQMIDGAADLFRGRFTLNTLLLITFLACCADGVFCLKELRVPACGAFTLEAAMAIWRSCQQRLTEMGQMDTLRKATRLNRLVKSGNFHNGLSALLREEGCVEDFMDHYQELCGPERRQNIYGFICVAVSVAVAVAAGILHGVSMAVQIFATTLLVSAPASIFVAVSRPEAMLERRLHRLGTVLCGWTGIKNMRGRSLFPLWDRDLFPGGTAKLNGVKFYGDRDPDDAVAYAAALMEENGGTLAPIFRQLLSSRNGKHYSVENMQHYGNGGIGGEVAEEPVLLGTLDFLKEMGVEIPDGVQVRQAVGVSIDGDLAGIFAINYSRMKYTANGMATLCGCRKVKQMILSEDFMVTAPFLKEKFGVNSRRMIFPTREERLELLNKKPEEDAIVLAVMTQEGLAPAAYAVTGARSLRTAWNLGLAIHIIGGVLGMLIMAALAVLGNTALLTPLNVLLFQLIWMIPGLLVTLWPGTI